MLAARDALDRSTRSAASAQALTRVMALDAVTAARGVMAYLSFGSELDTASFVQAVLARGSSLAVPRVDATAGEIVPYAISDPSRDTVAGPWGLREPDPARCARVALDAIDFVLVPGVAFTASGQRLGYGRGYYDRLIARFAHRPVLVAAAFEMQIVAELPTGPNDQSIDLVVTERAEYLRC